MLQALNNNKLGISISEGYFKPSEDSLTSSVFGCLLHLPDNVFWALVRNGCYRPSQIPSDIGAIANVNFWEKMSAEGTNNEVYVEPDVHIETDIYHIIVEAKKSDNADETSQYCQQWINEVKALRNDYPDSKPVILLAIGGNATHESEKICVDDETIMVFKSSWFSLLSSVETALDNGQYKTNEQRILADTVMAFENHRIIKMSWLKDLKAAGLNSASAASFKIKKYTTKEAFMFRLPSIGVGMSNIDNVWKIQ